MISSEIVSANISLIKDWHS